MINLSIAGSPTSAGISFFCTAGAFALFALVNHLCVIKTDFYQSKMLDEPNSKASDAELVSDSSGSSQEYGFSAEEEITDFGILEFCFLLFRHSIFRAEISGLNT